MSERKTTQSIDAEMCQVKHSDLSEFELFCFIICEYQRKYDKNAVEGVKISCM